MSTSILYWGLGIGLYIAIGYGCTLIRAYYEPILLDRGITTKWNAHDEYCKDYKLILCFMFLLWWIMMPVLIISISSEKVRYKSIANLKRQKELQNQLDIDYKAAEVEVEKILHNSTHWV